MNPTETISKNPYIDQSSILSIIPAKNAYIACGYTDLRRSIDGLATIVQQIFKLNPCDRNLFLFCGKRSDRIKALFWEGNGFIMLYKRLESGRFQWPRCESEARLITEKQLRWLLEGLSMEQPKALVAVSPKIMV